MFTLVIGVAALRTAEHLTTHRTLELRTIFRTRIADADPILSCTRYSKYIIYAPVRAYETVCNHNMAIILNIY